MGDNWLREYEDIVQRGNNIQREINERNRFAQLGQDTGKYTSDIRRNIGTYITKLDMLEQDLEQMEKNPSLYRM